MGGAPSKKPVAPHPQVKVQPQESSSAGHEKSVRNIGREKTLESVTNIHESAEARKKKIADEAMAKSRFEAIRQLMADDALKRAFISFLCNESMDDLEPKTAAERLAPMKGIPVEQLSPMANILIEHCNFSLRAEEPDAVNTIGQAFCNTTDYTMMLRPVDVVALAVESYPRFLLSVQYENWNLQVNPSKLSAARQAEITADLPFESDVEKRVFCRAMASVDKQEIERILRAGSVLSSIMVAVETLPVCVSIATARKDRPGFPLIYVNACFESVTGYLRNEIVGQNCRFLQASKSEQVAIKRLTFALKNAKPIRVAITNFRKDGMPFKNLLSMKPVFDENGEYSYVIGVQFDVTQSDATPAKLKLADDVINMLPNVIVSASEAPTPRE